MRGEIFWDFYFMKNIFDQKSINILILSVLLFIFGFLFFAFYNNWVVLFLPSYNVETLSKSKSFKQERVGVELYYWNNRQWNKEKINLLWCQENNADNIKYLINGLLNLLEEEKITKDRVVTLQSVLISSSGQQAYLSFDKNPFDNNKNSTHDKFMFVEGILKTIRENNIKIQGVYFLVNHKIMQDYHLDFSNPWPINGFLS